MTIITLGIIGAGFLIPSYTAPYGTLLGQLVLAVLLAGFVGVLAMMRQIADTKSTPRFLIVDPRSAVAPVPLPDDEPATGAVAVATSVEVTA